MEIGLREKRPLRAGGLGLSLPYGLVRVQGGEIKIETKVSEGSKFIMQLPKQ